MSIIEVLAENPFAAQIELSNLPEVMSVTQLGIRLRVLIPETIAQLLQLIDGLLSANAIAAQTKLVDASLEDVFVAVTQKYDATEQAA
jgi:ABC-2 type transport system ATP-binding protein